MKLGLTSLLLLLAIAGYSQVSTVTKNQEIVFYPGVVHPSPDGKGWDLEINGSVYKLDQRRAGIALLRDALGFEHIKMSEAENAIFTERARLFMVDHKAGRQVVLRFGEKIYSVGKSGSDGRFSGHIHLSDAELVALRSSVSPLCAALPGDDTRQFSCPVNFLDARGITVISDIDDTIKVTQVRDRQAMFRNTFLEPFAAVPGMAEVYRSWAENSKAQFCYVSASPWQLFLPLSEFVRSNGFPSGTFYLKQFRLKDESFWSLFQNPEKYKPTVIEPLMKRFPDRKFVLVGDSGERDPEVYGVLARSFPAQVTKIFIRDVTNEPPDGERFQRAFHDLPPSCWKVFREPSEIAGPLEGPTH
jgi:hypothetical protein